MLKKFFFVLCSLLLCLTMPVLAADDVPTISFTNRKVDQKLELEIQKEVVDKDGNQIKDYDFTENTYTFVLSSTDSPLPDPVEATTDDTGLAEWNPVEVEAPGQYHYTVKEKGGDNYGITYDDQSHSLDVSIDGDGNAAFTFDGKLVAAMEIAKITNVYNPEALAETGSNTGLWLLIGAIGLALGGVLMRRRVKAD